MPRDLAHYQLHLNLLVADPDEPAEKVSFAELLLDIMDHASETPSLMMDYLEEELDTRSRTGSARDRARAADLRAKIQAARIIRASESPGMILSILEGRYG